MHCRGVGGLRPEKTLLELEQLNGKVMQMGLRERVWGGDGDLCLGPES